MLVHPSDATCVRHIIAGFSLQDYFHYQHLPAQAGMLASFPRPPFSGLQCAASLPRTAVWEAVLCKCQVTRGSENKWSMLLARASSLQPVLCFNTVALEAQICAKVRFRLQSPTQTSAPDVAWTNSTGLMSIRRVQRDK